MTVSLTGCGKSQSVTQACYPRNLKPTSDYLFTRAGEEASSSKGPDKEAAKEESGEDLAKSFKWLLGESASSDVKIEHKWKNLQADSDTHSPRTCS